MNINPNLNNNIEQEYIFKDIDSLNKKINPNNNIAILHVNIRSINNNLTRLHALVERLNVKPDIIFCSEAWLKCATEYGDLQGYDTFTNESRLNKSDGVILYINNKYHVETFIEIYGRLKVISTIVKISEQVNLKFSGIYRCFNINEIEFNNSLMRFLIENQETRNHFVIGDVNIDLLNDNDNSSEYLSTYLENLYLPLINSITRPSNKNINTGTCIDHIFAKTKNNISIKAAKIENVFTDHFPILLYINTGPVLVNDSKKQTYNFNKMKKLFKAEIWNNVLSINDPNQAMKRFLEKFNKIVDLATKVTRKNYKKIPRKSWMTTGLINSCITKEENNYLQYSKMLSKLLKIAKTNFDKQMVQTKDSKKLWNFLNKKLNRQSKNRNNTINHIIDNGN